MPLPPVMYGEACPNCKGTGRAKIVHVICQGTGMVTCKTCDGDGDETVTRRGSSVLIRCRTCKGSGKVKCSCGGSGYELIVCEDCDGTGKFA
jgi:hypothetical protein